MSQELSVKLSSQIKNRPKRSVETLGWVGNDLGAAVGRNLRPAQKWCSVCYFSKKCTKKQYW